MACRWPQTAARQQTGLHLSSQRAPLWCKAHVWPGGSRLSDFSPWSSSQPGCPEVWRGVGSLGPKQLSVCAVAKQIWLLVRESRCEGGHPKHWRQAGAANWHHRQVENGSPDHLVFLHIFFKQRFLTVFFKLFGFRFTFAIPPVEAPPISMHCCHPPPSLSHKQAAFSSQLSTQVAPLTRSLHRIQCYMRTQFPDLRLIQYDCGKMSRCFFVAILVWKQEQKEDWHSVFALNVTADNCVLIVYQQSHEIAS